MPLFRLNAIPPDAPKKGTIWRHWKGNHYRVLGCGYHSDTSEILVFYSEMPSPGDESTAQLFARPLEMWADTARSGEARFTPIYSNETAT